MNAAGFLYQPNLVEGQQDWLGYPYTFYDAFNPDGAQALLVADRHALCSNVASTPGGWTPREPEIGRGAVPDAAAQVERQQTHMTPTGARIGRARAERAIRW